jgi:hypothetical protein
MTDQDLERRLRDWYRAEINDDEVAPAELVASVAAIPKTRSASDRRFGSRRNLTLFVAAAITTALIGGTFATGSGLMRLASVVAPSPSHQLPAETTPPATPAPSVPLRSGGWTVTGSMKTEREFHTATVLEDGRVLVAGGFACCAPLASAELYDPSSGTWSATASMAQARRFHTASRLATGEVLVTGGLIGTGGPNTVSLGSAEVYDPDSGTWRATGTMATARHHHAAIVLADGRVLVTGGAEAAASVHGDGSYSGRVLASAELYDPASGRWTATGSMIAARESHFAIRLRDDKVLVVGGLERGLANLPAELYDPSTGIWTAAGLPELTRIDTATLLDSGAVLVTGSGSGLGAAAGAEIFDPGSGTWTPTGSLNGARMGSTATLLSDGRVLVAGGDSDDPRTLALAELFDPKLGSWISGPTMSSPRLQPTAVLLADGRVLLTGGEQLYPGPHLWLSSAELYGKPPGS